MLNTPILLLALTIGNAVDLPNATVSLPGRLAAAYQAQCEYGVKGHWDRLKSTMAPDYISIDVFGATENAADTVKQAQKSFAQYHFSRCGTRMLRLEESNGAIVADIEESTAGAVDGKPLRILAKMTDTWIEKNGRLLIRKSVTHEIWAYGNGRLLQHVAARLHR